MNLVTDLARFYTEHFEIALPRFAQLATLYGWGAAASLIIALMATLFVIFNRERGRVAAGAIGQHILVYAAPILVASLEHSF